MRLKFVLFRLILRLLLIFIHSFCVAPSDKVGQSALLGVKDALLIFKAHIRFDLVGVRVECGRLQTDAIGEVTRKT